MEKTPKKQLFVIPTVIITVIISKIETTSKVSLKLLNKINLRRRGWRAELLTLGTPASPSSLPPTARKRPTENLIPVFPSPQAKPATTSSHFNLCQPKFLLPIFSNISHNPSAPAMFMPVKKEL